MNGAFQDGPHNHVAQNLGGPNLGGPNLGGPNLGGWYPDPSDPRGLRYWDGLGWTEHRAQLTGPVHNPAVCSCGVVAVGTCRVCAQPFCRAHISEQPREDRAYLRRWDAWTCGGCIELGRRELRAEQLARCESVAPHLAGLGPIRRVRTYTGLRPRKVHLFERVPGVHRPPRAAQAYLIEYDGGEETSTYQGLAISADGTTVYDVGVPMLGVKSAHVGPKRTRSGYHLRRAITIEGLREAAAAPTEQTWFEHASRAYLRAAKRLMIEPDRAAPPALSIVEVAPEPPEATVVPIELPPIQTLEIVAGAAEVGPGSGRTSDQRADGDADEGVSPAIPAAARSGNRRARRAAAR